MTNKFTVVEQFKIRQAGIKDVEKIAVLCDEQLGFTVTNKQVKQRLAKIKNNNSHIVYVCCDFSAIPLSRRLGGT